MATSVMDPERTNRSPSDEPEHRAHLTAALLERAHGEPSPTHRRLLFDQVVLVNRPVADGVARRYRNRGIAQEDLQQVAYEGLTKAVLRFDPTLADDLLTYAVPTIRGELQRCFRDQGWSVRPPRRVQELQCCIVQSADGLAQRLGREPRSIEVMAELGIPASAYHEALTAFGCKHATSLDRSVGVGEPGPLSNVVADDDREVAAAEARLILAPVVRALTAREREIVYLRFFEDLTQQEIGARIGVTQMQVSRLLSQILARMRAQVAVA
jgi:RNA polymerase sigma-B factor